MTTKPTPPSARLSPDAQTAVALATLMLSLQRRFPDAGECATDIPGVTVFRYHEPSQPLAYLLQPSICLILQGRKEVILGEQRHVLHSGDYVVTSLGLPVIARILEATPQRPYLSLVIALDRLEVARLMPECPAATAPDIAGESALAAGPLSPVTTRAVSRLADLFDEPEAVPVLAPLMLREILYRFLRTGCGNLIRQTAIGGSPAHRVARAIDWIRENLRTKLMMNDLAAHAGMSNSSLHHHFRQLTALSPLQYQKRLRLNEARRLMLSEQMDASSAAWETGYESPSQFSREYSRMFGAPPARDVRRLSGQKGE